MDVAIYQIVVQQQLKGIVELTNMVEIKCCQQCFFGIIKVFLNTGTKLLEYKPGMILRSVDSGQIVEPRVQLKHGEATFSCYAAHTLK